VGPHTLGPTARHGGCEFGKKKLNTEGMSAILMAKFPSQNKLMYVQENGVSNDAWTGAQSGGTSGELNLPKDLSTLNRRGYSSTTSKGVPLVFRCKVDLFTTNYDGTGTSAAVGSDFVTTLRMEGCQNNWVMRNAAVKWHAARESMFKRAGVKKSDRGAYSNTIRYGYDSYNDTWIKPVDGEGNAFTGGTWDLSTIVYEGDVDLKLKITGIGLTEDGGAPAGTALNIGHSYLQSRSQVPADSNLESSGTPTTNSILRDLLSPVIHNQGIIDDIIDESQDAQDNPPYELLDITDSGDVNHDITEAVELGRVLVGPGAQSASMIVDIPFGLAHIELQHYDAADTNTTHNPMWHIEVLDIYEMQG